MPKKRLETSPAWTPRPRKPSARSAESTEAYLEAMLRWFEANKIACIPKEFCAYAEIGPSTLKRYPEMAEKVNRYGWKTSRAKMRPGKPSTAARAGERIDSRMLRQHERRGAENRRLREKLADAEEQGRSLKADVEILTAYAAQLENFTEVLLYTLAEKDRGGARELAPLLKTVKERSLPTEFLSAIRQSNGELLS